MFTPRGYTAVPQEAVDYEDEADHLTTSYEQQRKTSVTPAKNDEGMTGKTSTENEEGAKEPRGKRNRVRFDSKSVDQEKQEPISKARRLCFVISLMICTLTIFVFAFTVPCKHAACKVNNLMPTTSTITQGKVQFHGNWTTSFPGYSSLAEISFHGPSRRGGEVIINYNKTGTSGDIHKRGLQDESKKGGILSLSGEHGDMVWLYNASYAIKLIECKSTEGDVETCLIESSLGELQLVEPKRNKIIWSTRILIGSISPSIIVNIADCDGDGVRDILLNYNQLNASDMVHSSNHSSRSHGSQLRVISGKTGYPIGGILTVPQTHLIKQISLHSTRHSTNMIFVLTVGLQGHLKVISIQNFYKKIMEAKSGVSIDLFQNATVMLSEIVSLKHPPLVKDMNQDSQEDIVLVTLAGNKHSLTAVDGGKLEKMWRISFGDRKILRQPVIGHFNGDDILDILVVLEDPVLTMLNQSLIQILNGINGDILWSRHMKIAQSTSPLSASIGHKSDVFIVWIEKEKVEKYTKTVPSKKTKKNDFPPVKSSLPSSSERLLNHGVMNDTGNNNTRDYHHRLRRNEASSHIMQSREKIKSSIREMEEELDSLVEEVNKQYSVPREQTELAKINKDEHTLKLFDKLLKKEIQPAPTMRTYTKTRQRVFETEGNDIGTTHEAARETLKNNTREYVISRLHSVREVALSSRENNDHILKKQFETRDGETMQKSTEKHNELQRKDFQTGAVMGISKKSNNSTSLSITDELASGGTNIKILKKIRAEISKKERKSLQSNFKLLVKNGTAIEWALNNRSSHETEDKRFEERKYFEKSKGRHQTEDKRLETHFEKSNGRNWRSQNVLDQVKDINTSSSLLYSQETKHRELKNGSISNTTIKQGGGDPSSPVGTVFNIKIAQESIGVSEKKDFKNRSKNPVVFNENNSSFKSIGALLLHQVSTTRKRLKTSNDTLAGYSNKSQHVDKIKKQNSSRFKIVPNLNSISPNMRDKNLRYDINQADGCKEGNSFALIAIFPNSRRNSFTVLAEEHNFRDKAAISQTSCDTYWPWINSIPIVRDVERDGFLEIFYVVNYRNQEELETMMKVKKFIIKLNSRP